MRVLVMARWAVVVVVLDGMAGKPRTCISENDTLEVSCSGAWIQQIDLLMSQSNLGSS